MSTYERWPLEKLIVRENVRKQFDEAGLLRHAESLKNEGQLRALLVLRNGTLVAGERTARAANLAGLTHVDVKVLEEDVSPGDIKKLQLVENLMREGLTDAEVYLACKELAALNPGMLKKDLAAELHFDPSTARKIFAVDDLIAPAKERSSVAPSGFRSLTKSAGQRQKIKYNSSLCKWQAQAETQSRRRPGRLAKGNRVRRCASTHCGAPYYRARP